MACLCTQAALSQTIAPPVTSYIPPSPNAAGLGIYGQIPVSEYSGVPDIKVPLYTINTNGFKLPIYLSYHAGGFRAGDEASWVGLGWALNCGGVITRSKRHRDDFSQDGFFRTIGNRQCGEFKDQEPDMFYYNFNGHTGKFMLDAPSANPVIRPFVRENIRFAYDQLRETWTLITQDGVRYIFDKRESSTEFTQATQEPDKTETFTASWYLGRIELPDNAKIYYRYAAATARVQKVINSSVSVKVNSYWPAELGSVCCINNLFQPIPGSASTTTVSSDEVVLSEIEYPTGKIVFNVSDRTDLRLASGSTPGKKLDKIDIYTKTGSDPAYLKSFELFYDYFNSGSGAAPAISTRLRLGSVRERTQAAVAKPHIFTYVPDVVPDKGSYQSYIGMAGIIQTLKYPMGGYSQFEFEGHSAGPGGLRIKRIYAMDPANKQDLRRFEYIGGKAIGLQIEGMTTQTVRYINLDSGQCCARQFTPAWIKYDIHISGNLSSLGETTNGYTVGYDKVITYYGENGENGKKESLFENNIPAPVYLFAGSMPVPLPINVPAKTGYPTDEYQYKKSGSSYILASRVHYEHEGVNAVTLSAGRYAYKRCDFPYNVTTEWVRRTAQDNYTYDKDGLNPVITTTQFYYDLANNALPTRIISRDSKNDVLQTTNYYVNQKSVSSGGVYTAMLNKNMIGELIEQDKLKNNVLLSKTSLVYKDWLNNGRLYKPELQLYQKGSGAAEIVNRFTGYEENGNVNSYAKADAKPVSYIWGYNNTEPIAEVSNAKLQTVYETDSLYYGAGGFIEATTPNTVVYQSFTTNYGQTITYTVKIVLVGTNASGQFTVNLHNSNGQIIKSNQYYSHNTYTETAVLPQGTDSYYFSMSWAGISGATTKRVDVFANYLYARPHNNIFHTSFEDLTADFSTDSKTGGKSKPGPYNVIMPWTVGKYVLSWWEKPVTGGSWTYKEQLLNITTTNTADLALGNNTLLLDEIRIYPADAYMTTYTYLPGVGATSKCDERNRITYYEYDELLRLHIIRDEDRNIIKTIEYNYKN